MRVPFLPANWKMNMGRQAARELVQGLMETCAQVEGREMAICPPFHLLADIEKLVEGRPQVYLGAQDMYWQDSGAFTGEISAPMLLDVGCRVVIIGHSERRAMFGETDETCAKKVAAAVKHQLIPILCVGESLEEREQGLTEKVVTSQLHGALDGLEISDGRQLIIAYEPIWAIGTGKTDTPQAANETMQTLRQTLAQIFNEEIAQGVRLLYGGSVKPENIAGFMATSDIDGALVGGASLKPSFAQIVNY